MDKKTNKQIKVTSLRTSIFPLAKPKPWTISQSIKKKKGPFLLQKLNSVYFCAHVYLFKSILNVWD